MVGRDLFGTEGCADCHGGAAFSDSAVAGLHDIGTLLPTSGPIPGIDTPTLRGLWMTSPYLHDGRAATIEEAIDAHQGTGLTPAKLSDLASYLEQDR